MKEGVGFLRNPYPTDTGIDTVAPTPDEGADQGASLDEGLAFSRTVPPSDKPERYGRRHTHGDKDGINDEKTHLYNAKNYDWS